MENPDGGFNPRDPRYRLWFGLTLRDWLLILFEWPYMTGIFSLISHELFGKPGRLSLALIAGSAFLSGFLIAFEIRTVVLPSLWIGGRKVLALGGCNLPGSSGDFWKIACAIMVRLMMAGVISLVTAICISSLFFRADLDTLFAKQVAQQNAHLADGAAERIDAEVADKRIALADATKRNRLLADQVGRLRGKVTTGRARKDLSIQLPAFEAQLAGGDAAVAKLRAEIDSLVSGRAAAVNRDVEASPKHAQPPHGILSDIAGLETLANADPHARAVMLTFEALFLALELALIVASMTDVAPSVAAGVSAYQTYKVARVLARMAAAETAVDDSDTPPPPPEDDVVPPANDNGAPAFDEPNFGVLMGGSGLRHSLDEPPPVPPRRPRGRPRKGMLN